MSRAFENRVLRWGPDRQVGALWIAILARRIRFYQIFTPCAAVFSLPADNQSLIIRFVSFANSSLLLLVCRLIIIELWQARRRFFAAKKAATLFIKIPIEHLLGYWRGNLASFSAVFY
jgi:hypothetical protein